ncbi:MAG: hypothetical protein AB1390_01470 [Nitrospirota bacterium]
MKRSITITSILFLFVLFLFGSFTAASAQLMEEYCQVPPFLSTPVEPNVLFVVDVSGSMGWDAYAYGDSDSNGDGILDKYNPAVSYEGYFTPSKSYKCSPDPNDCNRADNVYEETVPTGLPCSCSCVRWRCRNSNWGGCVWHGGGCRRWGCCLEELCTGDCNVQSGNYLNYVHMSRVDLFRWAMTGGTPDTCNGSQTFNTGYCDPELWNEPGNDVKVGSVCNNSLDVNGDGVADGGCILRTSGGERVKVPWDRVHNGLAFQFKELTLRPRMAVMFYSGIGVMAEKVYMGDFTAPNSTSDQFPYMNYITHINSAAPTDTTPTGPAMWDALNYYSQKSPEYGGFSPQSGGGDRWKNPMYICDQGGLNCDFVPCANNFVILLSDGQWNRGGSPPVTFTCTIDTGFEDHSADPVVPAYHMHTGFDNAMGTSGTTDDVHSKVTAVYTLGLFLGGTGEQSMKNIAMYGSYDNRGGKTWPDNLSGYPDDTCYMDDCGNNGKGSPCESLPASTSDWDKDSNGVPDTFYKASDALGIRDTILSALLDILRQTSSGTAVSILASGEGSGANLLQAFFYPKKVFDETEIDWVGEMQNLWYYLDPRLQSSTIREDTITDEELELVDDYIVHFRFDAGINKTVADLFDNAGNYQNTTDLDGVKNLWEAGRKLWLRNVGPAPRTLYTSTNGTSLIDFSTANAATLQTLLQAADITEASNIIEYVHGIDRAGFRNRTVINPAVDNTPRVWKLGDIISSTPKLQSWVSLNTYHRDPPYGYGDDSYGKFIESMNYKKRGMVYVGANDGMLHALKLGQLQMINDPLDHNRVAKLCDDTNENAKCEDTEISTVRLGQEEWAYIPENALPYLRYLTDPDYCHLFYVDASPVLVDASIAKPSDCNEANYWDCLKKTEYVTDTTNLDLNKTSWRTIIIGGMGQGGACKNSTVTCDPTNTIDLNGDGAVNNSDCVRTPIDGVGYSSYFAMDITDPHNPSLLWEFSHPSLGYSTTSPLIVRTGDKSKNGRWFAVFASGPTGPIDTATHQFFGRSDQNLRIFILDLKTGSLLRTMIMDGSGGMPSITNAFGGSILGSTIDADRWNEDRPGHYQDEVFYAGYVRSWTNGGVLRISTKESTNPNDWAVSTLIDGIGPVTASVVHLQDRKNHRLWLFFGTGRYYYKIGTDIDDADTQRTIFGVKEPCYDETLDQFISDCTSSVAGLTDATLSPPTDEPATGWYITLDPLGTAYKAERVITNPLAAFTGAVFFTTFAPNADICGFGGNTYLWALKYRTGGPPPPSSLYGTALVQVSTGEIKEVPLSSAFTEKGGRRTVGFPGVPPKNQGLTVVAKPQPIKKILHMQER